VYPARPRGTGEEVNGWWWRPPVTGPMTCGLGTCSRVRPPGLASAPPTWVVPAATAGLSVCAACAEADPADTSAPTVAAATAIRPSRTGMPVIIVSGLSIQLHTPLLSRSCPYTRLAPGASRV